MITPRKKKMKTCRPKVSSSNSLSIPLKDMYNIAMDTLRSPRTIQIVIPESIKTLDRTYMVQAKARQILKGVS